MRRIITFGNKRYLATFIETGKKATHFGVHMWGDRDKFEWLTDEEFRLHISNYFNDKGPYRSSGCYYQKGQTNGNVSCCLVGPYDEPEFNEFGEISP